MLTIAEAPGIVIPGCEYSQGTGVEGHELCPLIVRGKSQPFILYTAVTCEKRAVLLEIFR